jgi:hypothetical protein
MPRRLLPLAFALALSPAGIPRLAPGQQVAHPELVQPGVISTARHETFPAIDPVDGSLWFGPTVSPDGE